MNIRTFDKGCLIIGFSLMLSGGSLLIQPLKILGKKMSTVIPIALTIWGFAIILFVICSVLIEILEELQKEK